MFALLHHLRTLISFSNSSVNLPVRDFLLTHLTAMSYPVILLYPLKTSPN